MNLNQGTFGFFTRFAVLFGIPYLVLNAFPYAPLLQAIAAFQTVLLSISGLAASQFGTHVVTATQTFQIVPSCTGLVMALLISALLYSTPIQNPFRYALVFAPALVAFNQVRLFYVIYFSTIWPASLDAVHAYFWLIDGALVLFLWYVAFSVAAFVPTKNTEKTENPLVVRRGKNVPSAGRRKGS